MNQILNVDTAQQQALLFLLDFLKQRDYQFTTTTPLSHQRILSRKRQEKNTAITLRDIFGWNLAFAETDLEPALFEILKENQLILFQDHQWRSDVRVASLGQELFIHSSFPTIQQDSVFLVLILTALSIISNNIWQLAPIHLNGLWNCAVVLRPLPLAWPNIIQTLVK